VKRSQKRKRTVRKIEEEEEEEAKGCGARKKIKEKMKGVRRCAGVRQLRLPVFNIYMYIYYSDGARRGGIGPWGFEKPKPIPCPAPHKSNRFSFCICGAEEMCYGTRRIPRVGVGLTGPAHPYLLLILQIVPFFVLYHD
jgi:hypothetical protein